MDQADVDDCKYSINIEFSGNKLLSLYLKMIQRLRKIATCFDRTSSFRDTGSVGGAPDLEMRLPDTCPASYCVVHQGSSILILRTTWTWLVRWWCQWQLLISHILTVPGMICCKRDQLLIKIKNWKKGVEYPSFPNLYNFAQTVTCLFNLLIGFADVCVAPTSTTSFKGLFTILDNTTVMISASRPIYNKWRCDDSRWPIFLFAYKNSDRIMFYTAEAGDRTGGNQLIIHLPLVAHIWVSESGQHWLR